MGKPRHSWGVTGTWPRFCPVSSFFVYNFPFKSQPSGERKKAVEQVCSFFQPLRLRQGVGSTMVIHNHLISQLGCCNKNHCLGGFKNRYLFLLSQEAGCLASRCLKLCLL